MKRKQQMFLAVVALTVLAAMSASAAEIGFSPSSISMAVPTGDSSSTTVAGTVIPPPSMPYSISLQLRPVGGTMPSSWLVTLPATFTNRSGPLPLRLTVAVPAAAKPGTYGALVQPMVMAASIPLAPPMRPLQLSVTVTAKCLGAPTPAIASTEPPEFKAPNGRLADVSVAGSIVVPPGCSLARAWYMLTDEYGIFGETKDLVTSPDGGFSLTTPVQVSRRGDDRDGRAYRFTVYAADEAGTGASAPAAVVVRHDQRKEP